MTEWNAKTYRKYMDDHQLVESRAVKLSIREAAMYQRHIDDLKFAYKRNPSDFTRRMIDEQDKQRIGCIQNAISLAKLEKMANIKLLEEGEEFIRSLLIMYRGNMELCSDIEKARVSLIEELDREERYFNQYVKPMERSKQTA